MPLKRSIMADLPEIPPQNATIDAYITEVKDKIAWVEEQQSKGLRTTDYTLTDFSETKRDRMWKMKQTGEMTDTILITSDGQSEFVHMDIMLKLGAKEVFFGKEKASNESKYVKEYTVKEDISSTVLSKMVHYAYLEKCQLEEEPASLVIALSKTAFKYGLNSLLKYCIAHMMKNCSPPIAYFAYELTLTYNRSSSKGSNYASSSLITIDSKAAQTFFQKFIEDHFEELYNSPQKEDLLRLSFPLLNTVLRWNKLNVRSEETVWKVIHDWVTYQPTTRLPYLNALLTSGCLRLGRLSSAFLEQSVLGGDLFRAQDERSQAHGRAAVKAVLDCAHQYAALIFKDGHGLQYSKALTAFRPRATRQLLMVAGGWVDGKTSSLIEVFDHQSNLWLNVPLHLSHAVSYFGLEMVGTVIYVFGGSNGREIFRTMCACDVGEPMKARTAGSRNARVGQWERKADMLERRCYVSSTVLDGRVYAIGGFNQQDRVKKCERYDPTTDQWTAIADLNYSRSDATAVSHGGRIYVAGGINDNTIESSVEVYCPVGDRWQLVKAMASPRTSFSLASFDGRIWAMGGNDGEQRGGSCESFDPLTGVWRAEAPLVNGRSTFKAITFMGELYAIGGYNGQSPISTVEKYSPGSGHWRVVRHLRHDRSGMALLVLPNDFLPLKI
ncbi:hypothetical protein TYRP_007327 [Tyrophagus putrescentiae]|nr:hypothetical protein TYRP_007327 [Tyrophagus putrescentiae]